ncbi:MAG TPA: PQQ-binding-like beta-propeller repeat protein [Pirellulales bacterium]|jgi:outer membrane protein assembly factor BamB|nr:PQQ-binding-like beta-propeller repeat protein [Pirellulales bacterium]
MARRAAYRALAAWLLLFCALSAEEWPAWRGQHRDGVSPVKPPAIWPETLEVAWQVEVGLGHSSPVVSDRHVFIFTRRGEEEVLASYNLADGKEAWHFGYTAPYQVNPAAATHGKGPKSTPAVAEGRVFTFGISGILTCREAKTGKPIWRRDFSKQFPTTSPLYGVAMSPLVVEDRCIVHVGGHDHGALLALDAQNGETIWTAGDDGPAYASPILVTLDDVRQIVTQTQKACLGVDFEEGKVLWRIPFQTEYDQNSVTPLFYEGSLIISGINRGVDRYRVELNEDEWETDKVWGEREVSLYMSSPVADRQRLYGFSHRQKGQLFALDLTTGQMLWTSEGRLGENASLVRTGKDIWALTTGGELIVFKTGDKQFDQVARYHVADTPTWAHVVVLSDGVLVKDETKLTRWRWPKKVESARN